MQMQIHNVEPGSKEWLALRLEYDTASEAPAMMGDSKFMSRNQLLAQKKGWIAAPNSIFKEKLFESGHEHEASARTIMEIETLQDFPPIVGSIEFDGLKLLASFDGLQLKEMCWEHKDWNKILPENVRNGVLEPKHYWQLEQQMLVAGILICKFTVSDGTTENRESMTYYSKPDRRQAIIDGWIQFHKDLDEYEIQPKQEVILATEAAALPILSANVSGSEIITNVVDVLANTKELAQKEMNRVLETDLDFANKEQFNKNVKLFREKIKQTMQSVQGEFKDWAKFAETMAELDGVAQKMQSHGEGQIKKAKEKKKADIKLAVAGALNDFIIECNEKIKPQSLHSIMTWNADFDTAMKNKRNLESIQSAVDDELARVKIEITQVLTKVQVNLATLRELAEDYKFLFTDASQIINQEAEPFRAVVEMRISAHKEAEKVKLDAEREKIRDEELARIAKESEDAAQAEADRIAKEQETPAEPDKTEPVSEPISEPVSEPEQSAPAKQAVSNRGYASGSGGGGGKAKNHTVSSSSTSTAEGRAKMRSDQFEEDFAVEFKLDIPTATAMIKRVIDFLLDEALEK